MQLVKIFQCRWLNVKCSSEYMHFRAATQHCLHYTMITFGHCNSKSKENKHTDIYFLSVCGDQKTDEQTVWQKKHHSRTKVVSETWEFDQMAQMKILYKAAVVAKCSGSRWWTVLQLKRTRIGLEETLFCHSGVCHLKSRSNQSATRAKMIWTLIVNRY